MSLGTRRVKYDLMREMWKEFVMGKAGAVEDALDTSGRMGICDEEEYQEWLDGDEDEWIAHVKQAGDKANAIVELRERFYAEDSRFPAMGEADFPGLEAWHGRVEACAPRLADGTDDTVDTVTVTVAASGRAALRPPRPRPAFGGAWAPDSDDTDEISDA